MTPSGFPTKKPLYIDPALLMVSPPQTSSAPFQQSNTYRAFKDTPIVDDTFDLATSNLAAPSFSTAYTSAPSAPSTFGTDTFKGNSNNGDPSDLSAGRYLGPSTGNVHPSMTNNPSTYGMHAFTGNQNIGDSFDQSAGRSLKHSTSNLYPSMTKKSFNPATNQFPFPIEQTASYTDMDIELSMTYSDETISSNDSGSTATLDNHQFRVLNRWEHLDTAWARNQRERDHQTIRIEGQLPQHPAQDDLLYDNEPGTCELTTSAQIQGEHEELNTLNNEQSPPDSTQHSDCHEKGSKGHSKRRKPNGKASKPTSSSRKRKSRSNDDPEDQQSDPKSAKKASEPLTKSKLAIKRENMADKYGEDRVTKLATIKGEIRHNIDGSIDYRCPLELWWKPAIYHDDIRDDLIRLDQFEQPEAYAVAPTTGEHKLDITSNVSRLTLDLPVKLQDANMADS